MPAPSTIVYITDADGDEFPIRLWDHYPPEQAHYVRQLALNELEKYIERGEMKPTFPVTIPKMEQV